MNSRKKIECFNATAAVPALSNPRMSNRLPAAAAAVAAVAVILLYQYMLWKSSVFFFFRGQEKKREDDESSGPAEGAVRVSCASFSPARCGSQLRHPGKWHSKWHSSCSGACMYCNLPSWRDSTVCTVRVQVGSYAQLP